MSTQLPVLHGPWSHTRAVACDLNLYLKIKKVPREPRLQDGPDRRLLGTARHKIAELLLDARLKYGRWPNLRPVVQAVIQEFPSLEQTSVETEQAMAMFMEKFQFSPDNCLGSEMEIAVDGKGEVCSYDDCPPDGWRGRIDYVECDDDTLIVSDFKNKLAIFPNGELKHDEQVSGIYPWLVMKKFPKFTKFKIGIYYFEYGYHQFITLTKEEITKNFERLRERAHRKERLQESEIQPTPGPGRCNFCDYLSACSVGIDFVDERGPFKPTTDEDALEIAKFITVFDEKLKRAKAALKVWVEERGPVELEPGIAYKYKTVNEKKWDKELLLLAVEDADENIADYVNVNSAKAEQLLKILPPEKKKGILTIGKTTEFKLVNTASEEPEDGPPPEPKKRKTSAKKKTKA